MGDQRYSGWTNYETWAVNLWLANDEGLYNLTREMARECIEEAPEHHNCGNVWTREQVEVFTLADRIEEFIREEMPETGGVYADLLGAALSEVDWSEVSEHWIADEREAMAS